VHRPLNVAGTPSPVSAEATAPLESLLHHEPKSSLPTEPLATREANPEYYWFHAYDASPRFFWDETERKRTARTSAKLDLPALNRGALKDSVAATKPRRGVPPHRGRQPIPEHDVDSESSWGLAATRFNAIGSKDIPPIARRFVSGWGYLPPMTNRTKPLPRRRKQWWRWSVHSRNPGGLVDSLKDAKAAFKAAWERRPRSMRASARLRLPGNVDLRASYRCRCARSYSLADGYSADSGSVSRPRLCLRICRSGVHFTPATGVGFGATKIS